MNVLSLFDGMSCGRIALDKLGIVNIKYFASEIDKYAIKVSRCNWNDVVHIGDVTKVKFKDGVLYTENGNYNVGKIDLLLAGSPCQGFSLVGKRQGLNDPRSSLYFEFERIKNEVNPKFWLLENVKMKAESKDFISNRLGVEPSTINSKLLSAQNRYRLYWTNLKIDNIEDKNINLIDILDDKVDNKYFIKNGRLSWLKKYGKEKESGGYVSFNPSKAKCLTVRSEPSWNCTYWLNDESLGFDCGNVRKLTPNECEKLQTVPVDYSISVSDTQRYKMLGNGWTVDVIAHILKSIKG